MKNILKVALLVFAFLGSFSVSAQKVGYLNPQAILGDLPDLKAARSLYEARVQQASVKDSLDAVKLQMRAQTLQMQADSGLIAPIKLNQEKAKLEADAQKFEEQRQKMREELAKQEEVLFQPIYDRVNQAVKDVAKENGFSYVINVSAGTLLYADEKNDIENLVRKKLGLPDAAPKPADK